jgi:serine/threonine protein kinase/formylglycine-generating enzyme required for sulfatase activity
MNTTFLPPAFDGYRIIRPIGEGGMGRVYLAEDTVLDRPVAIKLLLAARPDPETRKRFLVEARAVARIQHPNVVTLYRVGDAGGCPYLVSEFVRGQALDQIPRPVPWQQVLAMGLGLARGLAVAHRHGVVHRDIKPANAILSVDGEVKLLDFGIARITDQREESTGHEVAPQPNVEERTKPQPAPQQEKTAPQRVRHARSTETDDLMAELEKPAPRHPNDALAPDPAAACAADLAGLTRPGITLGTPAYMAPEVWLGEPATCASDVYSLGALLYALCVGHPPHVATTEHELRALVTTQDALALSQVVAGVDTKFASVVDRCLSRSPATRFATGNDVRAALAVIGTGKEPSTVLEGNPYRGLRAFQAEHRNVFFGRDSEIRDILERLDADPMVLVAGDSGVGKSSLCRAGVLPRLADDGEEGKRWTVVTLVPGTNPVAALAAALAPVLGRDESAVATSLREDGPGLAREVRQPRPGRRGLVVFVDQLEELSTLSHPDEAERVTSFLGLLAQPGPRVRVLASARSDFLGRLATWTALTEVLPRALYFLRPLNVERAREAVLQPALASGACFESDDLVDELARAGVGEGGALPLLQFALAMLWDARDRGRGMLTRQALEAMGGVAGALAVHGDDVLSALSAEERLRARAILTRLVTSGGTRARRSLAELGGDRAGVASALEALLRGRLLVVTETPEGTRYEIAHEALLKGWPTLRAWLAADEGERATTERLDVAAREWERLRRSPDLLWGARQLVEAPRNVVDGRHGAFLEASRKRVRRRRRTLVATVCGVASALLLTWAGVEWKGRAELDARVDAMLSAALSTVNQAWDLHDLSEAERHRAFRLFDDKRGEEAETVWAKHLATFAEADGLFRQASQQLEPALHLAPGRPDVEQVMAEVLLQRAVLADQRHAPRERDELLERMRVMDSDGSRLREWLAPGAFSVTPRPRDAALTVHRYVAADNGTRSLEAMTTPAVVVGKAVEVPAGSYLLVATAPGYAEVRYPFTVARQGHTRVEVVLPRAQAVPPGFVPVLEGTSLFGSAAEDSQRRGFFHAVPMHAVHTPSFLVARWETTFADWMDYVGALTPQERGARMPRVAQGGFQGALGLREAGGSWELTYQPSATLFRVRGGQPLSYQGRQSRQEQDWRRFPVVGVSAADAVAYALWLRRTGKVPGARLCTEHEWERAARGADAREYPHGNRLAPDDANHDATYGKVPSAMGPDAVGSHPVSTSPFGVDDMSGNVWEWTVSSARDGEHAARGGSFYFDVNSARVANRETPEPAFRDVSVGFRVCADLPVVE